MIKTNIKMRVTPGQSKSVQEIVLAGGGVWASGSKEVRSTDQRYLFIRKGIRGTHTLMSHTIYELYEVQKEEEVDPDLFIRTNGTCEEPKRHPHPHAELMAEYAKDAAETDRPWERWETNGVNEAWINLTTHPQWYPTSDYRRKPQHPTVTMPDGTVLPEPLRQPPEEGEICFIVDLECTHLYRQVAWKAEYLGYDHLDRGLVHSTKENAKAWGDYLLGLMGKKDEDPYIP